MKLKWIAAALTAALCGTLAVAAAQDQDADEPTPAELRQAQVERIKQRQEELEQAMRRGAVQKLRRLQGAWQLVEYRSATLVDAGRQDACYLTVAQEFLTIEVHMGYFDEQGREEGSYMQTGTYRLNFDKFGKLLATCLIGSIDDGTGLTKPQQPGQVSVYEVSFVDESLILYGEDTSRFTFERVATGPLTKLLYEETDWLPGRTPPATEDDAVEDGVPVEASAPSEAGGKTPVDDE